MSAHPVDIHVGMQLRNRRKILGLSQEMLGEKVGVSFQQIQKYERGTNRIGSSRLYDFASILGVSVSYFFEHFNPDAPGNRKYYQPPETIPDLTTTETASLVHAYYRITDPAIRAKVLNLVQSLEDKDNSSSEE